MYIATTTEIGMDPYVDNAPRNWIPPRKRKTLNQEENNQRTPDLSKKLSQIHHSDTVVRSDDSRCFDKSIELKPQQQPTQNTMKVKAKELQGKENGD